MAVMFVKLDYLYNVLFKVDYLYGGNSKDTYHWSMRLALASCAVPLVTSDTYDRAVDELSFERYTYFTQQ